MITTPSVNEIYKYNNKLLSLTENERRSLQKTLNYNKTDILITIREFLKNNQEIHPDIKTIKNLLKKKSKKFIIQNYNEGNMYSIGADIDFEKDSYHHIALPIGDFIETPYASITFRYWKRDRLTKLKFDQMIVALRSNKVKINFEIFKEKTINKLKIETTDPRGNEQFWNTIKFFAKH